MHSFHIAQYQNARTQYAALGERVSEAYLLQVPIALSEYVPLPINFVRIDPCWSIGQSLNGITIVNLQLLYSRSVVC